MDAGSGTTAATITSVPAVCWAPHWHGARADTRVAELNARMRLATTSAHRSPDAGVRKRNAAERPDRLVLPGTRLRLSLASGAWSVTPRTSCGDATPASSATRTFAGSSQRRFGDHQDLTLASPQAPRQAPASAPGPTTWAADDRQRETVRPRRRAALQSPTELHRAGCRDLDIIAHDHRLKANRLAAEAASLQLSIDRKRLGGLLCVPPPPESVTGSAPAASDAAIHASRARRTKPSTARQRNTTPDSRHHQRGEQRPLDPPPLLGRRMRAALPGTSPRRAPVSPQWDSRRTRLKPASSCATITCGACAVEGRSSRR